MSSRKSKASRLVERLKQTKSRTVVLAMSRNRKKNEALIIRPRDGGPAIAIVVTATDNHGILSTEVALMIVDPDDAYLIDREERLYGEHV